MPSADNVLRNFPMTKPFRDSDFFDVGKSGQRYPSRFPDWIDGVYAIRDKRTKKILYVGESHSQRLYDTLRRHLTPTKWTGPTYPRRRVQVAYRASSDPERDEANLIAHYQPPDNIRYPKYLDFAGGGRDVPAFDAPEPSDFDDSDLPDFSPPDDDLPF